LLEEVSIWQLLTFLKKKINNKQLHLKHYHYNQQSSKEEKLYYDV
jgi:hypothetical protein